MMKFVRFFSSLSCTVCNTDFFVFTPGQTASRFRVILSLCPTFSVCGQRRPPREKNEVPWNTGHGRGGEGGYDVVC